jgi:hypothetical protein
MTLRSDRRNSLVSMNGPQYGVRRVVAALELTTAAAKSKAATSRGTPY